MKNKLKIKEPIWISKSIGIVAEEKKEKKID